MFHHCGHKATYSNSEKIMIVAQFDDQLIIFGNFFEQECQIFLNASFLNSEDFRQSKLFSTIGFGNVCFILNVLETF